jgi:hypothetical protein
MSFEQAPWLLSGQLLRRNLLDGSPVHILVGPSVVTPNPIMIATALIVVGAVLSFAAVVVFLLQLAHAPEGVEGETGFHYAQQPVVKTSRPHRAGNPGRRTAKAASSLKAHIPAA